MSVEPIYFKNGAVVVLDQSLLPGAEVWLRCTDVLDMARVIKSLKVRGAPLIGVSAAFGVALAALRSTSPAPEFLKDIQCATGMLAATRPTAVNLFWALQRMSEKAREVAALPPGERGAALVEEAEKVRIEDIAMCRSIGKHGAVLLSDGETVMTHCNAGALATAGYGTALGVLRTAVAQGKRIKVIARETRPVLQGARLTAWELSRDGIDVTVIPDAAAAHIMKKGLVHRVIVGADRIAANGDTANKIGTYDLALVAAAHGIPFHVAAPHSTVDFSLPDGSGIPIEERSADEVSVFNSATVTPDAAHVMNPAFDVTPAAFISSIITEAGVALPPFSESLARLLS
jgi:methylthioribose-1-phosphate isomerase